MERRGPTLVLENGHPAQLGAAFHLPEGGSVMPRQIQPPP
jgi:hypothetical protein